ncbi:MAG: zinc-dependent metalloprotease [Saprospiraceae bacterium]
MDMPGIYTVNWFIADAVYDGDIEEYSAIPVITLGGEYEDEFLIATHAHFFDEYTEYILSVEACDYCIDGMTVYVPTSYLAEYQKEKFSEQRNLLLDRTRIVRDKEKECKLDGTPVLYVSFGNINAHVEGSQIHGSIEVKTRTNEFSKSLVKFSTEVEYDTDVFGENAMTTQTIQPNFVNASLAQWYGLSAINLSSQEGNLSLEKNMLTDQQNFIVINTILQPVMVLDFTLPISVLNNLPNELENLIKINEAEATYFCEGREIPFEEIVIEQRPIGIYFENGGFGGNNEIIQYQFVLPFYNDADNSYQIDIHATSLNPTRLRGAVIKINYNSEVFTSSQTPVIVGGASELPFFPQVTSTGGSSFEISFVDNGTIIDDFQEISDNTYLYSIRLAVEDCTQSAGLSFDEIGMQGLSTYVVEGNINIPILYQPVYASNTQTLVVCCDYVPDIETLDPVNIIAGDHQVLTITGSGFGEYSGGSSVLFHNGGFYPGSSRPEFIAAGAQDFIINNILKWTDSEIQVKVASVDAGGNSNYSPGSGVIMVKNRCNEMATSIQELTIPYALRNYRSEGKAYRVGLRDSAPNDDSNGYTFEFDHSVVGGGNDIKALFGEALQNWCEKTEVNFKKNAEVNDEEDPGPEIGDGHNTISIQNVPDFEGAFTSYGLLSGQITCGLNTNSPNAGYIVSEIDIVLDESFFTNQPYIVREALMHELGHAQMLGHAWCGGGDDCLMYPTQQGFLVTGITENDATGANKVTTTSDIIINQSGQCFLEENPISGVIPISDGNCGETNATKEIDLSSFKIYPNPTSSTVSIEGVTGFSFYQLMDGQGRIVQKGAISNDIFQLDLTQNHAGIYLLMLANRYNFGYVKIIKI